METSSQQNVEKNTFLKKNSTQITLKLLLIGVLIIALLIPQFLVTKLVEERQQYSDEVNYEVSKNWSGHQNIAGPFLVIPYNQLVSEKIDGKNTTTLERRNLIINPNDLNFNGKISTDKKYRSLYEVILYTSDIQINGNFKIPPIEELEIKPENLILNESFISFIIGDAKGVKNVSQLNINGKNFEFKPSPKGISVSNYGIDSFNNPYTTTVDYANVEVASSESSSNGMHVLFPLNNITDILSFKFSIDLKGSNLLSFSPVGKNTNVKVNSSFPDPSFIGNFITNPETKINSKGFDASWTISQFQRNIPNVIYGNDVNLESSNFGVHISSQVDNYAKTERAAKYMVLIIVFTFLVVFITEIVNKLRIHIFQYTLIGLALVIFFTLLLSFGEYLSFDFSYLIASLAIIGLIVLYASAIFQNKKSILTVFGSLIGLFLFMYMIIQMEKYSLITGSIGVFIALAITMYATRKIQFYENENQ
jgi:inner membrane protein